MEADTRARRLRSQRAGLRVGLRAPEAVPTETAPSTHGACASSRPAPDRDGKGRGSEEENPEPGRPPRETPEVSGAGAVGSRGTAGPNARARTEASVPREPRGGALSGRREA